MVRVTHEIVHLVRVERAADQLAEAGLARDKFYDRFRRDSPLLMQNFRNRRNPRVLLLNKVTAKLLMMQKYRLIAIPGYLLFDDMGMGKVTDIVQERGCKQHPAVPVIKPELVILKAVSQRAGQHALQNQLHQMIDPDRVLKARMRCSRVNLLREGELPNPLKSEKRRMRQYFFQRPA